MADKINIKIKTFGGGFDGEGEMVATEKFFLRGGSELRKGCRWLEPGEIVALDAEEARTLLSLAPGHIEITLEPANRPLYFRNQSDADNSSKFTAKFYGRAERAKVAMAALMREMEEEAAKAEIESYNDPVEPVEEPIDEPEPDPRSDLEKALDKELENYEPQDNAALPPKTEEDPPPEAEEQPRRRGRGRRNTAA